MTQQRWRKGQCVTGERVLLQMCDSSSDSCSLHLVMSNALLCCAMQAVVQLCLGQASGSQQQIKAAQQYFQVVGSSPSECDTIPGRQAMASCFFLLKQYEDVLVFLNVSLYGAQFDSDTQRVAQFYDTWALVGSSHVPSLMAVHGTYACLVS